MILLNTLKEDFKTIKEYEITLYDFWYGIYLNERKMYSEIELKGVEDLLDYLYITFDDKKVVTDDLRNNIFEKIKKIEDDGK